MVRACSLSLFVDSRLIRIHSSAGAWHLPAAWDPLLPLLGDFQVETIALPSVAKAPEELCTMYDDAQAVRNAIVKILDNGQDVVVVAVRSHSGHVSMLTLLIEAIAAFLRWSAGERSLQRSLAR